MTTITALTINTVPRMVRAVNASPKTNIPMHIAVTGSRPPSMAANDEPSFLIDSTRAKLDKTPVMAASKNISTHCPVEAGSASPPSTRAKSPVKSKPT